MQNALRELREEGLIVSRQGSGVFVRERTERPVGLRPYIERAFEDQHVRIDFAGFSGETLHGIIAEPLDKIRIGRLRPESISVRLLLSDPAQPWAIPCTVNEHADSPTFRKRAEEIMRHHTLAIVDSVTELGELGLVNEVSAQVRVHPAAPMLKLYLINNEDAFFGFYSVREHVITYDGETQAIYDLMGKDAILFHHSTTDDDTSIGSQYVDQARTWFESLWTTVAQDYQR
ncbi:GntR family transcriptional regulator [Amycolatopsis rhizosphaerae]|uniref:GntR family transcriptional regulator n=1 Tax=Amycolatopsis rhizosphaerae TaxID=2053003 RepID=A0A558DMA8_9PSEU|nr:GntR family transcriptional regulator [Amycolatopsis rhizosphaerae]